MTGDPTPGAPTPGAPTPDAPTPDAAASDPGELTLRIVDHSEIGLVRKNNQDSGYVSPQLLLVADGMGGAAAGDLASAVAVDTIRTIDGPVDATTKLTDLAAAIARANDRIAELIEADYTLEGMGTTVTGALFDGRQLGLAHIGDSRAYLLRAGRLERLTHDHTWVQSLVDDGKISAAEATVHPHRSLLLKVLNGQPANEPDLTTVPLEIGDRILICSDGLCGLVEDDEIAVALGLPTLEGALDTLVEAARRAGGIDNITVVLAEAYPAEGAPAPFVFTPVLGAAAERDVSAAISAAQAAGQARLAGRADEDNDEDDEDDEDDATPPPPDEARYLPQPPHRGRLRRPLIAVLVLLLVAGAGLGVGYAWTRSQFFVGESAGQVAIFRGVSDPLPGVSLSEVYEVQEIPVADLPAYYQRMVQAGIAVADLDTARTTISELDQQATRCRRERGGSGAPSGSASGSTSPTASSSPSTSASTSPSAPRSTAPPSPTSAGPSSSSTATSALPNGQACR